MMRMRATVLSLASTLALSALTTACSVSVEVKPPHRFNSTEQSKSAAADFNGEEISIANQNGDLQVIADSSVTKITATVKAFAIAEEGTPQSDADAALVEVNQSLTLDDSTAGKVTVSCGQARQAHGKVSTGNTGCDLVVKVPAGKGLKLSATNGNGSVKGTGLAAADGAQIALKTNNGSVDATVTGGANITSGNGNITASLTPTKGCTILVSTADGGNGDVDLALPSDFAADAITFSAGKGPSDVSITGFSDLTASSTSRGTKGAGAASLTAKASSLGKLTVHSR